MKIFCIKDTKSGFMNSVSLQKNDEVAKRGFISLVHDEQKTLISMHPEDFELWCLGSIDLDTGIIISSLNCVISGVAVIDS